MRLAGLSIEGQSIRATIVNRLPGRATVVRSADFALPTTSLNETGLKETSLKETSLKETGLKETGLSETFREVLRTLREEDSIRGVVVGIGITAFSHHIVDLPLTRRQDIQHALAFELEKHLPLPPDEYVYDFITLRREGDRSSNLVLAALKSKLTWISEAVEAEKLMLLGIRCGAMEALNEFASTQDISDKSLFAYFGHDAVSMFGMNGSEPDELKVLRRNTGHPLEAKEMFTRYTKATFSAREPEGALPEAMDSIELDYSMPRILASSAYRKRRYDMLFTPGSQGRAVQLWQGLAPAALAAACLLLLVLTPAVAYYKDSSALGRVNQELQEFESRSEQLMPAMQEIRAIESRRRELQKLKAGSNRNIRAFRELSMVLPKTAWLTNFSADEAGKVEIQGYALRAADIIGPLEGSRLFSHVEFTSPITIVEERERFAIRMVLDPVDMGQSEDRGLPSDREQQ